MRARRGITLVETLVAIFVLTLAVAFVGNLLHAGLRHQARSERKILAVQLGRKKLCLLRAWARTPTTGSYYNFDQAVAAWVAQVGNGDPEYPGLVVNATVVDQTLYSPCTTMEAPYVPLGNARSMTSSAKKVKISVADDGDPVWTLDLVTLVADPTRNLASSDAVRLTPTSAIPPTLSPAGNDLNNPAGGSTVEMKAEALYPDGRPVPDLFFDWYIVPLGGTGTLVQARDGRTCRFINGVSTGIANVTTEGKSVVAVHGSYRGEGQPPQSYVVGGTNTYINISPVLNLGP